jgi:hypothetical protein
MHFIQLRKACEEGLAAFGNRDDEIVDAFEPRADIVFRISAATQTLLRPARNFQIWRLKGWRATK